MEPLRGGEQGLHFVPGLEPGLPQGFETRLKLRLLAGTVRDILLRNDREIGIGEVFAQQRGKAAGVDSMREGIVEEAR